MPNSKKNLLLGLSKAFTVSEAELTLGEGGVVRGRQDPVIEFWSLSRELTFYHVVKKK